MQVTRVLGKLEPGGAQLAILRLSRELQRRHGVQTRLLVGDATPDGIALARQHGVEPIAFQTKAFISPTHNRQWEQSARFANWLADKVQGADLVHAHMVGAWWAVAQIVDDSTPFAASEHNEVNWTPKRIRTLRPAAARIDRFYAMGPAARQFALTAGVRPDILRASRSPVAGLSTRPRSVFTQPTITFAGRFCADKGPDVLIEALALLPQRMVSACLLGDGPLRATLIARVEQLGLSARVTMPGWVADPWSYVAGSTVHVVPSREEAWSQSAVLGLGLGIPVVGTHVDGLANTLSQARGVLVPPDDPAALAAAITEALEGRSPSDRAGGIKYARQFTAAQVADFYLHEYQLMIEAAARPLSNTA